MSSRALAPTVIGVSLALAGCGAEQTESESPAATGSPPVDAAAQTLATGSARISVVFEHTSSDPLWGYEAGERGDVLEGVADFERHRIALAADEKQVIVDGTTIYFKDGYERDGRWQRYELDGNPTRKLAGLVIGRVDAVRMVEAVSSLASVPFTKRGVETVRGESTTRYLGGMESEVLAQAFVPGIPYEQLARSEEGRSYASHTIVEAWVGEDGLLRRVAYDLDWFRSLLGGERTIVELYDFGAEADIEPPAPADTVEGS
jgi:hypothetical protein